ncbi:MAG: hypothetical protein AAFQ77_03765 [Myxococcota bacterium]
MSLRATTTKRQSAEPAATREHPPSKELTREQRFKLAAEALRAGDRDRAVALLNENAAGKGAVVASLFGLQFVAGALGHLLPVTTMVAGMSAGFKSCEESDVSLALLVVGARAGLKPVPRRAQRHVSPPPPTERSILATSGPPAHHAAVHASKAAARKFLSGDLGRAANRFFRDAAKNSKDFRTIRSNDGTTRLQFFSPARNPGYGKRYVQILDAEARVVKEFKETLGPEELIEIKWIRGGP